MGNLFAARVGNILTALLGNVLTVGVGKVLDIYIPGGCGRPRRRPNGDIILINALILINSWMVGYKPLSKGQEKNILFYEQLIIQFRYLLDHDLFLKIQGHLFSRLPQPLSFAFILYEDLNIFCQLSRILRRN